MIDLTGSIVVALIAAGMGASFITADLARIHDAAAMIGRARRASPGVRRLG